MKIPKRINILGHPILVYKSNKPMELDDEEKATGLAHLLTNKIGICCRVDGDYIAESLQAETFLYEIFHHINEKMGLGMEEGQVRGMALGALQVVRDNKLNFLDTRDDSGKGKK